MGIDHMTDKNDLVKKESESIFQTYGRQDVLFSQGTVPCLDSGAGSIWTSSPA